MTAVVGTNGSPARPLRPVVVVHGGAGNRRSDLRRALDGCRRAAEVGRHILALGGSSLDAVEASVRALEDDPIFNAGTGAALNEQGFLELDASVMEGTQMGAGGVAALPPFKHPVAVARAVLEDGRHVLYAGRGAEEFAVAAGFEPATLDEMRTRRAVRRLHRLLRRREGEDEPADTLSTVGAVAIDARGGLAAATSTGGTIGQRHGRVGDTPVVGGGTYADDLLGACSATGLGEAIMRACLSHRAVSLLAHLAAPQAARAAVDVLTTRFGGTGGVIMVDSRGRVGVARSTKAMSHAVARVGEPVTTGF